MDIPQKHGPSQPTIKLNVPLIVAFAVFVIVGAVTVTYLTANRIIPVLPIAASAEAQRTDGLFYLLLLIGGFVFFLVQGLLLYSVIRFRAQPNDTSDGPSIHGHPGLEIFWTIIPAITVVVLAGFSVSVWSDNVNPKANENFINGASVETRVLAKRFQWSFLYNTGVNDVNGNSIVLSSPELHTYENQNVWLQMNAEDVIHSFWVPEMRIKQDVMPGKTTEIRFTPIKAGEGYQFAYEFTEEKPLGVRVELTAEQASDATIANRFNEYQIVCAELCGGGHGEMRSRIIVHESEDSFLSWYDAQVNNRINPPDDPVLLGEQLLQNATYQCASCHTLNSLSGWVGKSGPALNGIADRAADRASKSGLGDVSGADYIMHSIRHSTDYVVPGYEPLMPIFHPDDPAVANYMPDDHLIGIVSYLCTQTGSGNAADSTCGITFGEDGHPADVDATLEQLRALAEKYAE